MKKIKKTELIIFLALMILGALLRIIFLETHPAGFHGDEAWTGIEGRRILKDGFIGFWSPAALGQTALPFYWTAAIFFLFGESIFTTRLSFVLLNILWLPFFYLLIKRLFTWPTAAIATFLLCTGAAPLALARRADYVAANFGLFPALYFLLLALQTDKTIFFVATGIFLGITQHMYFSFWISPLLILLLLFIYSFKKRERFKKYTINITILFAFYFLIASPVLIYALTHTNEFTARSKVISIFSQMNADPINNIFIFSNIFLENIKNTILMFHIKGDPDIWSVFSYSPVYDTITGIFFLIGIVLSIFYFRRQQFFFIYFPFFFFLCSSLFTINAPNFRRTQASIYIGYIIIGYGIVQLYALLVKKFNKKALLMLLGISILVLGASNALQYFKYRAVSQDTKWILAYPLVKVTSYIKTLPPGTHIYFYSSRWRLQYETLKFTLPHAIGEDRSIEFGDISSNITAVPGQKVFIFLPNYFHDVTSIKKLFPGGEMRNHYDTDKSLIFISYSLI